MIVIKLTVSNKLLPWGRVVIAGVLPNFTAT